MDNDVLKLLPKKAFKLLSVKETFRIATAATKSVFDKDSYEYSFSNRAEKWKFDDIVLIRDHQPKAETSLNKEAGEKILKIYFSQFFEKDLPIHIDLRKSSFVLAESFYWIPSKLHYKFSQDFLDGVCSLYSGFYSNNAHMFEEGLLKLGMIRESMNNEQKNEMRELFFKHFGEGREAPVKFSLGKIQDSFNAIFSHFLKNDIPLNPEFALLGIYLVTLYLTLQEIPDELNVNAVFNEVIQKYKS